MSSISQRIEASGKTDAEIAKVAGVMRMTVWRWRRGRTRPMYDQIAPLARAIGCEPGDLLNDTVRDTG